MIYNQPGHPAYGACRRLHLKLIELFGDDLTDVESAYEDGIGHDWTQVVKSSLAFGTNEAHIARSVLKTMLNCHDTLQCQRAADRISQVKGPCRS